MYTSQYRFALLLDERNCQSNMGLSVSASRGLWPGCGYGPRQQRLRLTGAVHNALWCTSNCPDISLNWANAPPALQSALLRLSLLFLFPPSPKARTRLSRNQLLPSSDPLLRFNINSTWKMSIFISFRPLPSTNVFTGSERRILNWWQFCLFFKQSRCFYDFVILLSFVQTVHFDVFFIQLCVKCGSNLCPVFQCL